MYKDIPFALTKAANTDIKMLEYEKAVQQSVKNIVMTTKGELHYFPQFGCSIKKYLFEKINIFTFLAIRDEVKFALENFEPRISNINVNIEANADNNKLTVNLTYRINSIDVLTDQQITLGVA